MNSLYQRYDLLIRNTSLNFKRYLFDELPWGSRLLGIVGPRGVGKTTMILQYIKEQLDFNSTLYVSADDLYFTSNSLYELSQEFHVNGGKYLFIDEIHKYPEWSRELKNMYDSFRDLHVIFTGSSVLDILEGTSDLSRRALVYTMQGLSFREYLSLFQGIKYPTYSLDEILHHKIDRDILQHPIPYFKDYLKRGYYPFGIENQIEIRLNQIILQTLENDIPQFAKLSVGTSRKLKHLIKIVGESVPFKPNFTKLSEMIGISRNVLDNYLIYMEKAGLILRLRTDTGGIRGLGKIDKIYLDNPNLTYSLVGDSANIGNIRETYFLNQMRVKFNVLSSEKSDFVINNYTFEIGGKNKKQNQIEQIQNSFIVKDNIEYGYMNVVPLWAFGLTY
jgi:predicted AAA+ superfamily ATPase